MGKFSWRIPARCVAVFQLVFYCILVLFVILFVISFSGAGLSSYATSYAEFRNQTSQIKDETVFAFVFWTFVLTFAIFIIIGVWMCVILIKATNPAAESQKAIHFSKIWLIANWIFYVLGLSSLCFQIYSTRGLDWSQIINSIVHLLYILIVHAYKRELGNNVFQSKMCSTMHQLGRE